MPITSAHNYLHKCECEECEKTFFSANPNRKHCPKCASRFLKEMCES